MRRRRAAPGTCASRRGLPIKRLTEEGPATARIDKHPWRKQVKERIEEFLISRLPREEALDMGTASRTGRLWKAHHDLRTEYRIVVGILDFNSPKFAGSYEYLFSDWPKGRRQALQQMWGISDRALDDWHNKALDEMAESLGLKVPSGIRTKPRARKPEGWRETQRAMRGTTKARGWRQEAEDTLILLGHTLLMDPMRAPTNEASAAHLPAKHWAGAERGGASQSERRGAQQDAQADVHELVRDVLTNPQLHKLIRDRYWDRDVNHEHHPEISVEAYAQRLGVRRRRYYQLWDKALRLLAAYWEIPMNNPE